ncbi:MAG: hypothetical protein ACYS8W_02755 [Planctomycetota bacterium]|jgi:hypothetical protein
MSGSESQRPRFEVVKIFLLSIVAAVAYGIIQDQITARVCREYFTIGHPRIIRTDSATLIALYWGVAATWWVGAILAVPLACVSRIGRPPKWTYMRLIKPAIVLLVVSGIVAFIAGVTGYFLAKSGKVWLVGSLASRVPKEAHVRFIADLWAHIAAYGAGFVGGIILCIYVALKRRSERRSALSAENIPSLEKS